MTAAIPILVKLRTLHPMSVFMAVILGDARAAATKHTTRR